MKEISRKYWKINNLSPKPTQKYYKTQEFGSGTFSCFPKWCNKAYISLSVRGGAFTLGESFSQRKIKNKNSTNWKKFQENENTTNPKKPQNWRIWFTEFILGFFVSRLEYFFRNVQKQPGWSEFLLSFLIYKPEKMTIFHLFYQIWKKFLDIYNSVVYRPIWTKFWPLM